MSAARDEQSDARDAVERARALAAPDLERFYALLESRLTRQDGYLGENERAMYRAGKKLRPLLLLLSARMAGIESDPPLPLPDKIIKAAVSLEMLHVATLIHDDIVDVAPMRRGLPTVDAARGTEQALLIGDLQFIEAIRGFAEDIDSQRDMKLVQHVLDTGFRICCGELDEIHTDPRTEPAYLRVRYMRTIDRKTAVLFSLACESGAVLVDAGDKAAFYLSSYGRALGRAFQIMDDLLDLTQPGHASGKPRNADISARRLSLPIIYAMGELGQESLIYRIMTGEPFGERDVERASREVSGSQAFLRAFADARRHAIEASRCLDPFPPSPFRDALREIAWYVVDRPFDDTSS